MKLILVCVLSLIPLIVAQGTRPVNPSDGQVWTNPVTKRVEVYTSGEGRWKAYHEVNFADGRVSLGNDFTDGSHVILSYAKPEGLVPLYEFSSDLETWNLTQPTSEVELAGGLMEATFLSQEVPGYFRMRMRESTTKAALVLLEGQSNMFGWVAQGAYLPEDEPLSNMFQLSRGHRKVAYIPAPAGEWMPAKQPLQFTEKRDNGNTVSLGFHFARQYALEHPGVDVYIVGNAQGVTGFATGTWRVGDSLHEFGITQTIGALARLRTEYDEVEFLGVLWHQGETDVLNPSQVDLYESRTVARFNDQRERIGEGDHPIIVGSILSTWLAGNEAKAVVNEVHQKTPLLFNNAAYVSLDDLTDSADTVHFGVTDLRTTGARYYEAWKELTSE